MEDASLPSPRDLWIHWLVYPGHSLPTAAAPVLVAMGLAAHDRVFAALPALVAFLASWLIHIAGLFVDNHELLRKHGGIAEHPELLGAIERGSMSLARIRLATAACLILAALTGPYLLHVAGTPVIAIGLLGICGSLAYAAGPFPFGKHGLADPHFFLMFGLLAPVATYYVQMASHQQDPGWDLLWRSLPPSAWLVGLPLGALAVTILITDDVRDKTFDAAKGWRTGPVRFGIRWSRTEFVLMYAFAYLAPIWFWRGLGFGPSVLLPLLTLPFCGAIGIRFFRSGRPDDLLPLTPMGAFNCLAYSALLAIGLAVG